MLKALFYWLCSYFMHVSNGPGSQNEMPQLLFEFGFSISFISLRVLTQFFSLIDFETYLS